MAGRGKIATLPAWMSNASDTTISNVNPVANPIEIINRERGDRDERRHDDRRHDDRRHDDRKHDGDRSLKQSRSHSRDRRKRSRSPVDSKSDYKPSWKIKRENKISNFDVKPPEGMTLPPIGGVNSNSNNSAYSGGLAIRDNSQETKVARKIYVGNIPQNVLEMEISNFFNDLCVRGLPKSVLPAGGPPITSVYLNNDKCFAFLDMPSVDIANAAMKLDGIQFKHSSGSFNLRIKRPREFIENDNNTMSTIDFNLPEFQIVSSTVSADGAGKVFVGGLPTNLVEEQVQELLQAFGPLKAFNLVRDMTTGVSKGFAFCEYFDPETTNVAVQSLNEMSIGDKVLTVRINDSKGSLGALSLSGQIPTKVLRLENMISSLELQDDAEYEDILIDVNEECSQYGPVIQVLIPRCKNGYPALAEGYIFVAFATLEGATNAAQNLSGRKFADKIVIVKYVSLLQNI